MTVAFDRMQAEPRDRLAAYSTLSDLIRRRCADAGAANYMLLNPLANGAGVRIVASNWIYDTIELVGQETLARLVRSRCATGMGMTPRAFDLSVPGASPLSVTESDVLLSAGHRELVCLRLHVGSQRPCLILSGPVAGGIDLGAAYHAQIECCYALSASPQLLSSAAPEDPLSDRERECLYWVSEGKTTDEVALILGVSSNTVNSYITHAIQKFAAANRAMAIATAIRSGFI